MADNPYYDGTKLLSLLDADDLKPEIYICTSNRTAGKTTYWSRYIVNRFIKYHEKFMLVYRNAGDLEGDVSNKFFKDIGFLFFPEYVMTHKAMKEGYCELFLNDVSCGYAVSLYNSKKVKECSHLFSDVARMFFDEFMPEDNRYLPDEPDRLQSIHMSVARGQSKMVRYVPCIMVSNPVTLLNPYYIKWGISDRLRSNTKFLRGTGWVLEQGFNETASAAQMESGFNRAYGSSKYMQYAAQGTYLNDTTTFIERIQGEKSRYLATIKYQGQNYAIREYPERGILYCDDHPDITRPIRISVTTEDHDVNYVMLKRSDTFISYFRYFFDRGCFRFKNLKCKEAVFKMLSYS